MAFRLIMKHESITKNLSALLVHADGTVRNATISASVMGGMIVVDVDPLNEGSAEAGKRPLRGSIIPVPTGLGAHIKSWLAATGTKPGDLAKRARVSGRTLKLVIDGADKTSEYSIERLIEATGWKGNG